MSTTNRARSPPFRFGNRIRFALTASELSSSNWNFTRVSIKSILGWAVKIEIGESLMRSWLRHVQRCQLAELNWKPSSTWDKSGDGQHLMNQARVFFQRALEITLFPEDGKASQLIKQAEIDVLGVRLDLGGRVEAVYGADVALHENGLQYKDNVVGILKKLVRGRIATGQAQAPASARRRARPFVLAQVDFRYRDNSSKPATRIMGNRVHL
jgi:hypothetical protein